MRPFISLAMIFTPLVTLGAFTACSSEPAARASEKTEVAPSELFTPSHFPDAALEQADVNTDVMASGLKAPWSLAFLPSGDMIVTEKFGGIVRISTEGKLAQIENAPQALGVRQGGLQDIILSPTYASDSLVYIAYSYGTESENGLAIHKAKLVGNRLEGGVDIYRSESRAHTTLHYGGRMVFMPDGSLMVSVGEGSRYREKSQNIQSDYGKMLRLTPDGKAAAGNPFGAIPEARKEMYSLGHRNPQGMIYDATTQRLWAHEHGPKGGDELNLILAGKNYGWPVATFGIDYNGSQVSPFNEYEGMVDPVHHWTPSIAPSGMTQYRGDLFPSWDGDLLVGSLKFRRVHRLEMNDDGTVKSESIVFDIGERVRDIRTGPDGAIYILTDDRSDGKLLRLTPK